MQSEMTKAVLQITNDLGEIKGDTRAIKEKVDSHDKLLQNHGDLLTEINKRTFNLDSWKNGIIESVAEEKEKALAEIREEFKPMKDEYEAKQESKKEVKSKLWGIIWGGVEKVSYIVVGYIITKYKF
jgi:predicted GTPase